VHEASERLGCYQGGIYVITSTTDIDVFTVGTAVQVLYILDMGHRTSQPTHARPHGYLIHVYNNLVCVDRRHSWAVYCRPAACEERSIAIQEQTIL
jgi:hypothetical protein